MSSAITPANSASPQKPSPSTRTLTRSSDNLRRPTGFVLGNEHAVGYGYDVSGRLATLSAQGLPNLPGKSHAFEYTYEVGSSLLDKVTGPVHEVDNAYEPHRDVLLQKTNTRALGTPAELSVIGYTVNAIGQREQRNLSGEIRADFHGGQSTDLYTTDWGYDALGQVNSEDKPSTSADRGFSYDQIGNRLISTADTVTTSYSSNALNQYTSILPLPVGEGGGEGSPLQPAYDADGNMTSGLLNGSGNGQFEYDGANQLILTQSTATSEPTKYAYDAMGRRFAKVTYPNAGGLATAATVFLYDGWNLIAEYKLNSGAWTLDRTYTWGLDLSGSTQGAGGVGGLLAVTRHQAPPTGSGQASTEHFYPIYDGNGNIEAYLDSNGQAAAIYQYDAFGNILSGGGKGAAIEQAKFSHRFSTKYQDAETGLLYYGYRYMDPVTGRWINRDPIEESGGANLYGFVGNSGINDVDDLGKSPLVVNMNDRLVSGLSGAELAELQRYAGLEAEDLVDAPRSFCCEFEGDKVRDLVSHLALKQYFFNNQERLPGWVNEREEMLKRRLAGKCGTLMLTKATLLYKDSYAESYFQRWQPYGRTTTLLALYGTMGTMWEPAKDVGFFFDFGNTTGLTPGLELYSRVRAQYEFEYSCESCWDGARKHSKTVDWVTLEIPGYVPPII